MIRRIVSQSEEMKLVETIIAFASQHKFTATNIMDAAHKAMTYMANNAVLNSEDYICDEIKPSSQAD